MMNVPKKRPGLFLADAIAGLAIVALAAVVLGGLLSRQGQAARELARTRALTDAAERALVDLQAGHAVSSPPPPAAAMEHITEERLDAAAPRMKTWVRV